MKRRIIGVLAALALVAGLGASAVTAAPTSVETFAGNYACPAGTTGIDPVASGTYDLVGGGSITITVRSTAAGPVFDFDTSGATVGWIVVKGGPKYNLYTYAGGTTGDDGLHSPLNLKTAKWYGLSHLCIGSAKKDDPDPKK